MSDSPQRRISLEEEKFNYSIDFVFYGFLISIASARPTKEKTGLGNDKWELYLPESRYKKCRPILKKWLGDVTLQTIRNRFKKLIEKKMVEYDKEKKEYTFPYDENEKYFVVSRDIIFYFCAVTTSLVIQTYIYLASRFAWKQNYEFSATEIKNVLGYSDQSQNVPVEKWIKAGLIFLKTQGFIDFDIKIVDTVGRDDNYKTQRYILKNVVTSLMPDKLKTEIEKVLPELKPDVTLGKLLCIDEWTKM